MKELETKIILGEKIENHQQVNQKQEYKFIESIIPKSGRDLWSYNPDNDEMKRIEIIKKGSVDYKGNPIENQQAQYNPYHLYFWAVNEKNARKKLNQYRQGNLSVLEDFQPKEEKMKFVKIIRSKK